MNTVYRSEDVPAGSRLEYFREILNARVVPLEFQPAPGSNFHARIVTGDVGALHVTQVAGSAGSCARTPRLTRRKDPDLYMVAVVALGYMATRHDGRQPSRLGQGDFFLDHSSRPFWHAHPAIQLVTVSFPRSLLPLPANQVAKLTGVPFPGDHGVGALVSLLVRRLPRHLDDPVMATKARLGTSVLDLLTVALADRLDQLNGSSSPARQRTLLPRIYAFIEEELADPELSPSTVAAAHHISVRYLHRLFQDDGRSVAGWIRERRLERCRRDLVDPALADRSIGATAARWGFGNHAHFNRVFRATYGLPPGEYRATHSASPPVPGSPRR
jgi:AraC-like DNA-binding protein